MHTLFVKFINFIMLYLYANKTQFSQVENLMDNVKDTLFRKIYRHS